MASTVESTIKALPSVTLGKTTYKVEEWDFHAQDGTQYESMTVLTGPRGAQYFLRGFLYRGGAVDTGLRQVISMKSGMPLRQHGNEVRVFHLGGVIEVAS